MATNKRSFWSKLKKWFKRFYRYDIGIDLGTANSLVYIKGEGIVLSEPSVVAVHRDSGRVQAVGEEARQMIGKTGGNIKVIRPLKDGVINDFESTELLLRYFIKKANKRCKTLCPPRVLVAVPSCITQVEEKAVIESASKAGASFVTTIAEPMAAAIGAGLPVDIACGNMVVDIGGGTTEVAIISLGDLVECASLRVGGDSMDQAIKDYIRRHHSLNIGDSSAEDVKKEIGSAFTLDKGQEFTAKVRGRDQVTGMPKTVVIKSEEIREALHENIQSIMHAIRQVLENCPPELAANLLDYGIALAGGGAQLRGLDKIITSETGLFCYVCDDPLTAVARGTGKAIDNMDFYVQAKNETEKYGRRYRNF